MLTVITNPSEYNFSRSPVICEIGTDNMYTSGNFGDKAKFIFYIKAVPVDGDTIVFNTGVLSYFRCRFTAGIYPLGMPIPLNPGGISDYDYYVNYVLIALTNSFYPIVNHYNITYVGGGGFMFEAINPGPSYSDISSGVDSGTGYNFTKLQDGTDNYLTNVPRPNYKIGIDVQIEPAMNNVPSQFNTVYSADKEPFDNKVKFDISDILDTYLDYHFPTENQNTSNTCLQTSKHFRVFLRETYGTPPLDQVVTATPDSALSSPTFPRTYNAFILKAGLSTYNNRKLPKDQLNSYLWSYPLNLSVRHPIINLKKKQPEYIYFCFPDNCVNPVLKVTTKFIDGTTTVGYQSLFSGTMYKGFVGCFPVNYNTSELSNQFNTGNASTFTVQIVADADHSIGISPEITYVANYDNIGNDKIFLYTNSLGGIDTFRTKGEYLEINKIEKEVSSRVYNTSDAAYLGQEVESQNVNQKNIKVFSGWLTIDEIESLEELFLAKYKVEVDENGFYQPITIVTKEYKEHDTNEFLRGIEIEYYYQNKNKVTDRLAAAI